MRRKKLCSVLVLLLVERKRRWGVSSKVALTLNNLNFKFLKLKLQGEGGKSGSCVRGGKKLGWREKHGMKCYKVLKFPTLEQFTELE